MLKQIIYEEHLHVKIEVLSIKEYPLHVHEDIQIICVLEGEIDLKLTFATYRLVKNQVHFIHSEDVHGITSVSEENLLLILSIDTAYFLQLYPNLRTQLFSTRIDEGLLLYHRQQLELKFYLFSILSEMISSKGNYKHRILEISKQLLNALYEYFRSFTIDTSTNTFAHNFSQDFIQLDRISRIVALIYNKYNEKLSFTKIAEDEHINRFYLSHIFQRFTGLNFRDFVCMVRVERSEISLLSTQCSITHIALDAGFSNASYYIQHFEKWFGLHPSKYRQAYQKKTLQFSSPAIISHELDVVKDVLWENLRFISASKEKSNHFIVPKIEIDLSALCFHKEALLKNIKISFDNPDIVASNTEEIHHVFLHLLEKVASSSLSLSIRIIEEWSKFPAQHKTEGDVFALLKRIVSGESDTPLCLPFLDTNHNANGILTKNGLKKNSFYLFKFLLDLDAEVFVSEKYICSKNNNTYRLLFWNSEKSLEKELHIHFQGISPQFKIKKQTIFLENNALKIWKYLGFSQLSSEEFTIINQMTAPKYDFTLSEKELPQTSHFFIPSNTISFITLEPFSQKVSS